MILLKKDEATAALRRLPIYLVDVTDGFTPETGLSSGFTVEVSENGAAQASGAGSITEIGEGQYYYEATVAELSTLGFLAISIRHANCRDFFAVAQVVGFNPYTAYSIHSAADIWTAGSRALTTPADYKATGFSVHSAADVWGVGTKVITGGSLTTPADYKANVSALALEATVNALNNLSSANVQTVLETNDLDHLIKVAHPTGDPVTNSLMDLIMNKDGTQTFARADDSLQGISEGATGGGATAQEVWEYASPRTLTTPADYKATGFSVHNADAVWSVVTRELSTPANYKADVSALALEATVNALNNVSTTEVNTEVDNAIVTYGLDHLVQASVSGTDIVDNSIIAKIVSKSVTADWDTFVNTNDSLEAIRDRGDSAWTTGGAGGIDAIINVVPSIPSSIDVSATKLIRLALYIIDSIDDLPTTAEITPGTITIDRSADGGTSWINIVNAAACSEHAGCIYYDEVFDSGTGYVSSDMIRITFKGQKVTIATNDFEITDATDGMVFTTRIDSGLSGGGPSAGDIADAVWNEPIVDHTNVAQFGGKNQKVVPSETLADYKANVSGLSTHNAAAIWTAGSRELSTPANYKATGFSTHNAAAIWSEVTKVITGGVLTTPADYKANVSGLSTHTAANVWSVVTREITGGVLTTPANYKATGFSTHTADNVWGVVTRQLSGTISDFDALDTALDLAHGSGNWEGGGSAPTVGEIADAVWDEPIIGHSNNLHFGGKNQKYVPSETINDYKADVSGVSTHNAAAIWTTGSRELSTPNNYKANVTALALEATVLSIKALTDNLPANTELELIKLKGVGGIWLVAEYHHNANNDNDYIQFWQYGNQTDFDNETKANAVNKWRQDTTYSTNLPVKAKWDKVT